MSAAGGSAIVYRQASAADVGPCTTLLEELIDEIAAVQDAPALKAALPADMRAGLGNAQVVVFLAEVDGLAVGLSRGDILCDDPTFRLRPDRRCGYIDQMYVQAPYRDRGVGQALLALCEQWFGQQGVRQVLLHAAPKAVRLYARLGYMPNRQMYKNLSPS